MIHLAWGVFWTWTLPTCSNMQAFTKQWLSSHKWFNAKGGVQGVMLSHCSIIIIHLTWQDLSELLAFLFDELDQHGLNLEFSRINKHINWTSDINSSQTHNTISYASFKHDHYGSRQHLSLRLSFRARGWMTSSDGYVSGTRVSFY